MLILNNDTAGTAVCSGHVCTRGARDARACANVAALAGGFEAGVDAAGGAGEGVEEYALWVVSVLYSHVRGRREGSREWAWVVDSVGRWGRTALSTKEAPEAWVSDSLCRR